MTFVPIRPNFDFQEYDDIVKKPLLIRGEETNNEHTTHIKKHVLDENDRYKKNINCILYLRNNKSKRTDIINILNHDVMLDIDKRYRIYNIMKKNKNINNDNLFPFIEKLMILGYENLEEILINDFTITDILKHGEHYFVFKDYQIKNKEYKFVFDNKREINSYIRDII